MIALLALAGAAAPAGGVDTLPTPISTFQSACVQGRVELKKSVAHEISSRDLPRSLTPWLIQGVTARHFRIDGERPFFLSVSEQNESDGTLGRRVCQVGGERVPFNDAYYAVNMAAESPDSKVKIPPPTRFSRMTRRISNRGFLVSAEIIGPYTVMTGTQLGTNSAKRQADAIFEATECVKQKDAAQKCGAVFKKLGSL